MVYPNYNNNSNQSSNSNDQNRKIFLGGLNYITSDETLRDFCLRFGKITDCLVMRTSDGKSRGFGFVTYEDSASVEQFMRARPHTLDNRQIDPKRAMPREDQNSVEAHMTVKKLFVAGLREGITEEHLKQHFLRFGNITDVSIMKDRDGKPRGFAFVTYDDYDAVDKAVLEKPHLVNGRQLDVKKAVPKDKMQETAPGKSSNSGGMSFNRSNSSNYSNSGQHRGSYGSMRDNYDGPNGSWDNQGGMQRMPNQNNNYNQPPVSMYDQQGSYNTGPSGYNTPMPSSNPYQQGYGQLGQGQTAPPPPPPPPPSSSMPPQQPQSSSSGMNYDIYNKPPPMSYSNSQGSAPVTSSSYMQPPVPSYGQNPGQSYSSNMNSYNSMNNPYNLPPAVSNPSGSTGSSVAPYGGVPSSASFDNSASYGVSASNYGTSSYGNMPPPPPPQSRGGGPIRGGRSAGANGNYGGPSSSEGAYGGRPAPYSTRGTRGGRGGPPGNVGGRGRGRGH